MKAALFCALILSFLVSACVPVRDVFYYRQRNPAKPEQPLDPANREPTDNDMKDGELETAITNYENVMALVFHDKCIACHRPEKTKGDVDLTSLEAILENPEKTLIVPGKPEESLLYQVLDKEVADREMLPHMPPKKEPPLSAKQIEFVKRWVESL